MNNKIFNLYLIVILSLSFLFPNPANAADVTIDNFDVIPRTIPSTSSAINFRLLISQQNQSLDCSNLPLTNGNLEWVIWYDVNGFTTIVRRQTVDLPLSSNPKNLDFQATIQPSPKAIQTGGMNFRAALGCRAYIVGDLNRNLAVSALVPVTVGGGGPGPGGPVPGPGGPVPGEEVSFELTNPIQAESLIDLVKAIAKFIFQIAIPIAVILIIWVGIMFLKSGGNQEKIKQAKQALFYIIIGLTVIFIGQGFITLIKSILNLGK